ncbi:NADP-dependent isocitrate dehydrogenase [Puniceicoccales bacterium CK1056]|uniref:Isocitrate dehydrogenase [NADP] n=1 Tax=Oceanipulchritudo coccoides TaxID=2706888 RepID=A0A6B2M457_9BACT|nr:NADP-dependent isocitrate dehydrogenase [Oceanipulchritudo coccoides]NDV63009.1 NADP-dependent isocitrate dehydrogenase [Oceanipulchritudo coccoides]
MSEKTCITVARGDGIGPEIMEATLKVLEAAGARLSYEEIEIGEKQYLSGQTSGISPSDWKTLLKNRVFLKAPITTPLGSGYKSLNVTIRKSLRLFSNVRPCNAYAPYVTTNFPKIDMVIIRENEEDLYAGIEHQQTDEVVQTLKLVSRPGCEAICRYAMEYARAYGRRKVTCLTKSNIMKHTDGLFQRVFEEICKEPQYADIETEHRIIDIGAALVAAHPEDLDVIVTLNLYGDIVSDIAALVAGSVGLAGSANIGFDAAMFEAVHGSAPDIAGKDIANPSGLLNAATMMLVHLDQGDVAMKIRNAWLKTLEDGIHTVDIYKEETSKKKVGTQAFADAVIERLGQMPETFKPASFTNQGIHIELPDHPPKEKKLVGIDVFIDWEEADRDPNVIGDSLAKLSGDGLLLKLITNRGVKVYPDGLEETFCTDHWRCRFVGTAEDGTCTHSQISSLMLRVANAGFDFIKTEHLYTFNGERGYSLAQGE